MNWLVFCGIASAASLLNFDGPVFLEVHVPEGMKSSQHISERGFAFKLPDAHVDFPLAGRKSFLRMRAYWSPMEQEHWQELTPASRTPWEFRIMLVRDEVKIEDLYDREKLRQAKQPFCLIRFKGSLRMGFKEYTTHPKEVAYHEPLPTLGEAVPVLVFAVIVVGIVSFLEGLRPRF